MRAGGVVVQLFQGMSQLFFTVSNGRKLETEGPFAGRRTLGQGCESFAQSGLSQPRRGSWRHRKRCIASVSFRSRLWTVCGLGHATLARPDDMGGTVGKGRIFCANPSGRVGQTKTTLRSLNRSGQFVAP